jgi:hypothetical protein
MREQNYDMRDYRLLFRDFDHVVLKPEHIILYIEPGFNIQGQNPLRGMEQERKDKSIIIVNHSCKSNCPYQRKHYLDMIDGSNGSAQEYKDHCHRQRELLITSERYDKLRENGFSNFKIGRTMFYLIDTLDLFPSLAPVIPWQKSLIPIGEKPSPLVLHPLIYFN